MTDLPSDQLGLSKWLGSIVRRFRDGDPSGWEDLHRALSQMIEQHERMRERAAQVEAWHAQLREWEDDVRAEIEQIKAQRDHALSELGDLRRASRGGAQTMLIRAPRSEPESTGVLPAVEVEEVEPPLPYASLPEAVSDSKDAMAVGAVFAAWCSEAGPAVSERAGFAARLASNVPGATVHAVYRDRDSARLPVVFSGAGGRSPAEYWVVEGVGGPWLLPFPHIEACYPVSAGCPPVP